MSVMSNDTPFNDWQQRNHPKFIGYDGGDSEPELIKAMAAALNADMDDAIARLKTKHWTIGAIFLTATAKGYTKFLGAVGWLATNFPRHSHQHVYNCTNSLKLELAGHDLDAALAWYRTANVGWRPSAQWGPKAAIELVKKYRARDRHDAPKSEKQKGPTKAQLTSLLAKRNAQLQRLAVEDYQLAGFLQREPRVLIAIQRELNEEEDGALITLVEDSTVLNPALISPEVPPEPPAAEPEIKPPPQAAPSPPNGKSRESTGPSATSAKKSEPIETNRRPRSGSAVELNNSETAGRMAERLMGRRLEKQAARARATHAD
jgi:hypothetical protein